MRLSVVIAILVAAVCCTPVYAETISMAKLIDTNGFIDSGDKRFDMFEYNATGDMPPAEGVNVITFIDTEGNYGITLQGVFLDHFSSPGGSDALIRYRVTALDPDRMISDAHLAGNPIAIGDAIMQVGETFLPTEPGKSMSIHSIAPGGNDNRVDSVEFDNLYRSLLVQKDILAMALTEGSAATMSMIDQSFSQVIVGIPEPSTFVALLSGLALLGCCVRRFR